MLQRIRRLEDLTVYRLSMTLRREIIEATGREPILRDFDFVRKIRSAARGAPRNIAEGFSRFAPAEFRQFLSYAKASIDQTRNQIVDGRERGYFTEEESLSMLALVKRIQSGTTALIASLASPEAERNYQEILRTHRGGTRHSRRKIG